MRNNIVTLSGTIVANSKYVGSSKFDFWKNIEVGDRVGKQDLAGE